jgi:DNA polymerase-3 subunit delta
MGVHAIVGADSFLAEQALERILAGAVSGDRESGVEVLRGEESTWSRVVDTARAGSLFAPRRAVVVRRAEQVKGDEAGLVAYLESPVPEVALVLLYGKLDKRKASSKRLEKLAELTSAEPLKPRALRSYVEAELKRRKLPLNRAATDELIEQVGQDLRRLIGELDKLEAWGVSREMTPEEVSRVLGRGIAQPLYRLSDAFAQRRTAAVLEQIHALLEEGEEALRIVGTLQRTLRQLWVARDLAASRAPNAARLLSGEPLRVIPFKARDLLRDARSWPEGGVERAREALQKADTRLKTSGDPRVVLVGAIAEALGGGARAR